MENAGFATDDDRKVTTTTVEVETSLTAEDNATAQLNGDFQAHDHHHQHCEAAPAVVPVVSGASQCEVGLCEEAKTRCSCVVQKPKQKVELQSWVHPKGWVLLGVVLCLTAWIIVYFTVTHFYKA